jgi:oligopeptide transport system permease protein
MAKYTLRRLVWIIPVLFVVAGITFLMMHAAPGGPWDRDPNTRQVDAQTQKMLNTRFNLDQSLGQQFISYMLVDVDAGKTPEIGKLDLGIFGTYQIGSKTGSTVSCGALCLNLGPSYRQRGRDVENILLDPLPPGNTLLDSRFGYSIRLGVIALIFAIAIGIPLGVVSALRQNTAVDYGAMFIGTIGVSVPNFVLGILLIVILATGLKLIPVIPTSWTQAGVWVIPVIVLGFGTLAVTARLMRTSMLEVMRQDYIRTARAKGLPERTVVIHHMLRNALIPVVTTLGPSLAGLIVGSFIIESMFSFPGVGREYVTSISNRDYSMIMATTLLYAVLIALANLSVDLLYAWLDPRIKVGE